MIVMNAGGPSLMASSLLGAFSPGLAAGAAALAVAVPLVIHLLFRKRYQVVPWAAMRFLRVAEKRHRRRLEQWLLLAARVLAILLPLLGMAAATPWAEDLWQRVRPGELETLTHAPRTHHVLVIDASLSMTTRRVEPGGLTRFDHAKSLLKQAIENSSPGDGFTLIHLGDVPELIVPGPSHEPSKVLAELETLGPTHTACDATAALAMVADVLAKSPRVYPRRQVMIATDLQRSAWGMTLPRSEETKPEGWAKLLGRADVAFIDVAAANLDNLAIVDVSVIDPLPVVGAPIAVRATVQNFGRTERRLVEVALEVERPPGAVLPPPAAPSQRTRSIGAIAPGSQATVHFTLGDLHSYREAGLHVLRVQLREGDALAADDRRATVVDVREALEVVLVNGRADPEPLRRATEYLSRALRPPGVRSTPGLVRPRTLSPGEFNDPVLGDLSTTDCDFLCDVPDLTPSAVAKLETHLKRGGGLVVGLGPNAAANREAYNRLLFNDGNGLLPGPIGEVVSVLPTEAGFRLAADNDAFRMPPLAAFASDTARAGLVTVPFRRYVRLESAAEGRGERLLSFVPAEQGGEASRVPDPAVVAWPRERGRVVVYTSTFNSEWTDWPVLPSFLPFMHELLRYTIATPDRHNLRVGVAMEEYFPPAMAGRMATREGPEPAVRALIEFRDSTASVRFPATRLSGEYRIVLDGDRERVFAVRPASENPAGGSESDLQCLTPHDTKAVPGLQVVAELEAIRPATEGEGGTVMTAPRPWGPGVARLLVIAALMFLAAETVLAWRLGPARSTGVGRSSVTPAERSWWLRLLTSAAGTLVLLLGLGVLAVWIHAEWTGQLLSFLPGEWRREAEAQAGVPAAAPGEGTRWRLEGLTAFVRNAALDRQITLALVGLLAVAVTAIYLRERRALGAAHRLVLPGMLRLTAMACVLFLILPQLRLAFDREGWPDVVILLDTSASMGTVDDLQDPAVKQKAEELGRLRGVSEAHRLQLAQWLLTRSDADWLDQLLTRRQVRVHVYSVADQTRPLGAAEDTTGADAVRAALLETVPDGSTSRLGDGVQAVLKAFRGGSLAAVVMFTDGVTTQGDGLGRAGQEAARDGVPLFLVGVGDAREKLDLVLSDLLAEDVVTANDEMVFQARVTARGPNVPKAVPVVLYEKTGDALVERARVTVSPDAAGNPVPVDIRFTPTESGERTFVIEVPPQAGEADESNNRLERVVMVAESRRARVLLIEGSPRYEYRFLKALLERETDGRGGVKSVDLKVLLLNASLGWAETDRSALPEFPTRDQLFEFDVVILGDVQPQQLPRPVRAVQDLADFVKLRGGGLLVLSGEHVGPAAFADTPLADVLPIAPLVSSPPRPTPDFQPIVEGYRLHPTAIGLTHPLFRFAPGEAESRRIGNELEPLLWFATGYKRKLSAEVLATHPTQSAEGGGTGENHPLVLQQFAGAGRVLFLGFDETWRWRFRNGEEHFNRFWKQAIRMLSRSRLGRIAVRTDKQTPYRRDEKMTISVRFPDDAPAPPAEAVVKVTVQHTPLPRSDRQRADVTTTTLQLEKVDGSRARYEGVVPRTSEGDYRIWLTEPDVNNPRPRAEAKVLPPKGELDELDLDRTELARAAEESHGHFYTFAEADQVLADLPDVPRVPLNQPCPPLPLWNHPWLYGVLALLLSAEWLLRKRERLL